MGELVNFADWKRVTGSDKGKFGTRFRFLQPTDVEGDDFMDYRGFCILAAQVKDADRAVIGARIILSHDMWGQTDVYTREFDFDNMMLLGCAVADQIIANRGVTTRTLKCSKPNCEAAEGMPDGA
jgi:hypothetical protein